ncbi:MAG: flavin reductase family protein [Synergistaceae bacterium]|nr:flavin reductase family protein [Synergistaceae bacterium]
MDNKIEMKSLFSMTYGMYIVSTAVEGKLNGQVANAVMQITGDPVCVTTCLNKANLTAEMIGKSGFFSVSILEIDVPMTFIGQFGFKSGRDINKFENVNFLIGETGAPMVTDWSIGTFEAKVLHTMELPTHVLFVGEVISCKFLKEATPLTYADYHLIKKGKSPKTAPTFGFNTLK